MVSSPPKDLTHHFSRIATRREASNIKRFYKYFQIPGMGNLAGGLPNPNYFPYDTLEAQAANPDRFKPIPNHPVKPEPPSEGKAPAPPPASRVLVPHDATEPDPARKIDLATALQYGQASGYPPLASFVKDFALNHLHKIPYTGGADTILTCGSTDGFWKILETFTNAWDEERDWLRDREGILCEEFVYGLPLTAARPKGLNVVPVSIDAQGMVAHGPGGLAEVLERWDRSKGKIPHLLYTITMGQNPTSGLMSLARRKEIYAICQKYDILIVEDDPYWYLQYPSANEASLKFKGRPVSESVAMEQLHARSQADADGRAFLNSLVPSSLSIDVDGRVLRIDTFSKTIAPGCRLGWITAQPEFIERLLRITECSTQQPSGFVQSLVSELIVGAARDTTQDVEQQSPGWQIDGWVRWLEGLRGNYERRMQTMGQILEDGKHHVSHKSRRQSTVSSPEEGFEIVDKVAMFDFEYPMAGMFLWLQVHFETHTLFKDIDHGMLSQALWVLLTKHKVLVAPGTMFAATLKVQMYNGWKYFRVCFAAVNEDEIAPISRRLVDAMNAFWEIDDVKTILDLVDEISKETFDQEMADLALEQDKGLTTAIGC